MRQLKVSIVAFRTGEHVYRINLGVKSLIRPPNSARAYGLVVEPGPRRRPAEPQIVGSNPTQPAITQTGTPSQAGSLYSTLIAGKSRGFSSSALTLVPVPFKATFPGHQVLKSHVLSYTNWEHLFPVNWNHPSQTSAVFNQCPCGLFQSMS